MEEESFIKIDIDYAKKLLSNIRVMKNLGNIEVINPQSGDLTSKKFKDWMKWYCDYINMYGGIGIEEDVLKVFSAIDNHNYIMVERIEEGFRRLLNVIDKKDEIIERNALNLQEIEKEIIDLKKQINMEGNITYNVVDDKIETIPQKIEEPIKKLVEEEIKETKPKFTGIKISV